MQRVRFGLVDELFPPAAASAASDGLLVRALRTLLDEDVALVLASSYAALTQRFVHGEVDVAWLTPTMLVESARASAVGRLVGAVRRGRAEYGAALVVRDDDGPRALDGLRGTRVAWVDPWSAAGYLFPRRALRRAGLDPAVLFAEQLFYGNHASVLHALERKEADAGAVYCGLDAADVPPWGDGLRALARTEAIPGDALCISARLDAGRADRIARRLCDDVARPVARLLAADGFVERTMDDYASVRQVLEDEWGRSSREP